MKNRIYATPAAKGLRVNHSCRDSGLLLGHGYHRPIKHIVPLDIKGCICQGDDIHPFIFKGTTYNIIIIHPYNYVGPSHIYIYISILET